MSTVQFISRPEGRIAYTLDGDADAPLVVLAPGMGDLRSTWRDLVDPLTAAGYRIARLDLRGHGDSDTTFATHGDVVTGQDIIALVEHLGGPAVVGGSSMGAAAAAWAAAERPDLVVGLVLTGPLLRDPPASAATTASMHGLMRVALGRPWGATLWARLYRTYFSRGAQGPWLEEHAADIKADLRRPGHLRSFRHLSLQLTHAPVEARLPEVDAPVIAFVGELDPDFKDPAAEALWLRSAVDAEVTLIPGVGHYPQHQAPDVVAADTLAFLASLPRTGTAFAVEAVAWAGLDHDAVVELALGVVDDGGPTGYADLTLAAVAARAGVAVPSLYKHVDGLPGLRRDVALVCVREFAAITRGCDTLTAMSHATRAYARATPGRYDAVQGPAWVHDPAAQAVRDASAVVVDDLARGVAALGVPRENRIDAVRAVRASVHGFVVLELTGGFGMPEDVDASFAFLVDGLVRGLARLGV